MRHMTDEEEEDDDEGHWGSWEIFQGEKQAVEATTDLLKNKCYL